MLDQGKGEDLDCRDARRKVGASLCFVVVENLLDFGVERFSVSRIG